MEGLSRHDGRTLNAPQQAHHQPARGKHVYIVVKVVKNVISEITAPCSYPPQEGHAEVVSILLERGADIKKAANDGRTPLYIASEKGHAEVV